MKYPTRLVDMGEKIHLLIGMHPQVLGPWMSLVWRYDPKTFRKMYFSDMFWNGASFLSSQPSKTWKNLASILVSAARYKTWVDDYAKLSYSTLPQLGEWGPSTTTEPGCLFGRGHPASGNLPAACARCDTRGAEMSSFHVELPALWTFILAFGSKYLWEMSNPLEDTWFSQDPRRLSIDIHCPGHLSYRQPWSPTRLATVRSQRILKRDPPMLGGQWTAPRWIFQQGEHPWPSVCSKLGVSNITRLPGPLQAPVLDQKRHESWQPKSWNQRKRCGPFSATNRILFWIPNSSGRIFDPHLSNQGLQVPNCQAGLHKASSFAGHVYDWMGFINRLVWRSWPSKNLMFRVLRIRICVSASAVHM